MCTGALPVRSPMLPVPLAEAAARRRVLSTLGPGKLTWPDRHGLPVCNWQCQRQLLDPLRWPDTGSELKPFEGATSSWPRGLAHVQA